MWRCSSWNKRIKQWTTALVVTLIIGFIAAGAVFLLAEHLTSSNNPNQPAKLVQRHAATSTRVSNVTTVDSGAHKPAPTPTVARPSSTPATAISKPNPTPVPTNPAPTVTFVEETSPCMGMTMDVPVLSAFGLCGVDPIEERLGFALGDHTIVMQWDPGQVLPGLHKVTDSKVGLEGDSAQIWEADAGSVDIDTGTGARTNIVPVTVATYQDPAGNIWMVRIWGFRDSQEVRTGESTSDWSVEQHILANFSQPLLTADHGNTATQVSPTPSPTTAPPAAAAAWSNPEAAFVAAARERGFSSGSIFVENYLSHADMIRNLYPLVTANVGNYNLDTDGFYSWLKDYIVELNRPMTPDEAAAGNPERGHVKAQIRAALEQPTSTIGLEMYQIAAGLDPIRPTLGPDSYWTYLFGPYLEVADFTPDAATGLYNSFGHAVQDYQIDQFSDPAGTPDFGTYLVSTDFYKEFVKTP